MISSRLSDIPKRVRIRDGSFPHALAMSAAGDNENIKPTYFEWCRDNNCDSSVTFFTDMCLEQVETDNSPRKIGWLIEPNGTLGTHYKVAIRLEKKFDAILTYEKDLLNTGRRVYKFYPHGGSWIARDKWGIARKSKEVCIIVSKKKNTYGQALRHEIVRRFGRMVDVYGRGYNPVQSKFAALAPYRFAIIIESVKRDYYFTEKLIDCLSVGTIPIYWGCPSIDNFFDARGIIEMRNITELQEFLATADYRGIYNNLLPYAQENLKRCDDYWIPENWIARNYTELFR
ncbi:hypothetical protein KKE60_08735 [Patescibacteria group bacterium]|nr:hypothetical protein [Patescibacteria group bacterium]